MRHRALAGSLLVLLLVHLLVPAASSWAADDITVSGGSYSGTLRGIDVQSLGKLYQAIVIGDAVTANTFLKITGAVPSAGDNGIVTRQVGLPAAAPLADAVANPTLTQIGTFLHAYNGATWDRVRVNANRRLSIECAEGCATTGDTVGTTQALGGLNQTSQVALAAQRGAQVFFATGTLNGGVVAEASFDGGTTWDQGAGDLLAAFQDPVTGVTSASRSFTGSDQAQALGILVPAGATHVRVRVSSYTSGSTNATPRATSYNPAQLQYATDGTRPRELFVTTNVSPGASDVGLVVTCKNCSSTGGSSFADNAAFTGGTTSVTGFAALFDGTPPSVTDGNAGIVRMNSARLLMALPVDAAGDDITDGANNALRTTAVTVQTDGGQSAPAAVAAFTNCTQQAFLRMPAAATTQLLAAGGAGVTHRLCKVHVQFDTEAAGNTLKFVRGTGTNCGTGQADLTSIKTKSYIEGPGMTVALDGGAANEQFCATLAGTSAASIDIRYASY